MANILPRDLPPKSAVSSGAAVIFDDGTGVYKATPEQIIAGVPIAGRAYTTLAAFKAAQFTNKTQVLQDPSIPFGQFNWETANAPYTADDVNIIKADSTALSVGAWVRQTAGSITAFGKLLDQMLGVFFLADRYGLVDDNFVSDQTTKLQAMLTACATNRWTPVFPKQLRIRVSAILTYDPSDLLGRQPNIDMSNLTIQTNQKTGIIIGSLTNPIDGVVILLPAVIKSAIDWTGTTTGTEAGIVLRNLRWCTVTYSTVRYFTIGVLHYSQGFGYTLNSFWGGAFVDCRYQEVANCAGADSYFTDNKFHDGTLSYTSASAGQTVARVAGTLLTYSAGGYRGHNNNHWDGRSYEMTDEVSTPGVTESIPIYLDGCGSNNTWTRCRAEQWRGPMVHVAGDVNGDANAVYGINNDFDFTYVAALHSEAKTTIRQVGGGCGNFLSLPGQPESVEWRSGPLRDAIYSGGPADGVRVIAPFVLREGTDLTDKRELTFASRAQTNIYGAQFLYGGIFLTLDTSTIKDFTLLSSCLPGFEGRWFVEGRDASGAILGDTVTDSNGTEKYVKFAAATGTTLYGGGQISGFDNPGTVRLTVRDEVKSIVFAKNSPSGAGLVIGDFGFRAQTNDASGNAISTLPLIIDPLFDAGYSRVASANPATAGTHGFYGVGQIIGNLGAASGQPSGWVCTTAGALGVPYATSTAFGVVGQVIIAGSNAYFVKTPGTTAGSGSGPTGTTPNTDYTDGSVVFRYVGAKAVFVALANVP